MIKIKKLSDCKLVDVVQIWNDAFRNYSQNIEISVDQFVLMLGRKELLPSTSLVVHNNEQPVGFVLNSIKNIKGIQTAWNGGTGISKDYQGKGIGKILMDATLELYSKEAVELATLEVLKNNTGAISLYEKEGYRKVSRLDVYQRVSWNNNINLFQQQRLLFDIKKGAVTDVRELPFYNNLVPWESKAENIFNGESLIISDRFGTPLGYALFKNFLNNSGELTTMLFQCEIIDSITKHEDQKLIIEHIFNEVFNNNAQNINARTADFISKNNLVSQWLLQNGFIVTNQRFLMEKMF
jgi:ribosomal protein S18 acetylase RimI-like enzyme